MQRVAGGDDTRLQRAGVDVHHRRRDETSTAANLRARIDPNRTVCALEHLDVNEDAIAIVRARCAEGHRFDESNLLTVEPDLAAAYDAARFVRGDDEAEAVAVQRAHARVDENEHGEGDNGDEREDTGAEITPALAESHSGGLSK